MGVEQVLRSLDFSENEIKVYITLSNMSVATVSQIAKQSSIPRNKAYEVVERLTRKGFLMELSAKPKQFKIQSYEKLNAAVREKRNQLEKLEQDVSTTIKQLEAKQQPATQETIWLIKGQKIS